MKNKEKLGWNKDGEQKRKKKGGKNGRRARAVETFIVCLAVLISFCEGKLIT